MSALRALELLRECGPRGASLEDFAREEIRFAQGHIAGLQRIGFQIRYESGDTSVSSRYVLEGEPSARERGSRAA